MGARALSEMFVRPRSVENTIFEYNGGNLQYNGLYLTLSRANGHEYNGGYLQYYGIYVTASRAVLESNICDVSADYLIYAAMSCASTKVAASFAYNRIR